MTAGTNTSGTPSPATSAGDGRRTRRRRLLWLALAALLLWFLFELNRFLPGAWPGGGGTSGSRRAATGTGDDPRRVAPGETEPPTRDVPPRGFLVVVRGAEGTPVAGVDVALASGRKAPDPDGRGAAFAEASPTEPFVVTRQDGTRIAHGTPPEGTRRSIRVAWPSAAPPDLSPPSPGSARLRAVDEEGKPVAGAHVELRFRGGTEALLTTGADGTVAIPEGKGGEYRACVSAEGTGEACAYGSTARAGALDVRLHRVRPVATRFVDPATGKDLESKSVRLVGPSGHAVSMERSGSGATGFSAPMPTDVAASQALEVEVTGRPVVRVPLSSLAPATPIPLGLPLVLSVTDASGRPKARARVEVRYPPAARAESGDLGPVVAAYEADESGRAEVPLPVDRPADVLVVADDAAPHGFRPEVPAGGKVHPVVLGPGVPVRVSVVDEAGLPVPGADVVVLGRAGNAEARRVATTGRDGSATTAPLAEGVVEVYAHRAGYAWGLAREKASAGGPAIGVTLRRGFPLHVVVEDPWGVPIPGVSIRSTGSDAQSPDARPWATDDHGVLSVDDLPDRPFDLVLSKSGYSTERVSGVRPGAATWFFTLVSDSR